MTHTIDLDAELAALAEQAKSLHTSATSIKEVRATLARICAQVRETIPVSGPRAAQWSAWCEQAAIPVRTAVRYVATFKTAQAPKPERPKKTPLEIALAAVAKLSAADRAQMVLALVETGQLQGVAAREAVFEAVGAFPYQERAQILRDLIISEAPTKARRELHQQLDQSMQGLDRPHVEVEVVKQPEPETIPGAMDLLDEQEPDDMPAWLGTDPEPRASWRRQLERDAADAAERRNSKRRRCEPAALRILVDAGIKLNADERRQLAAFDKLNQKKVARRVRDRIKAKPGMAYSRALQDAQGWLERERARFYAEVEAVRQKKLEAQSGAAAHSDAVQAVGDATSQPESEARS